MNDFPHELALGDVYFSPVLALFFLSFFATSITVILLNKFKVSQFIVYPQLSFLAILTLYIVLIDALFIKF